MKLTEKRGGEFTPHPPTKGTVKAVIVDVTPLKTVQSEYGDREVFRLVYESEVEEDGKRCCVWSRPFTPSLNEKANFRKELKKIMGRSLTKLETEEFETESLVGMGVELIIQHEEGKDGKTYAVISFIGPDADPIKPSGKYTRVVDRPDKDAPVSGDQASYRKAPAAAEDEGRTGWQKVKVHVGKHSGVDLGDLPQDAVDALIKVWLPLTKANPKPKADDKRLMMALIEVQQLLGEPVEEEASY